MASNSGAIETAGSKRPAAGKILSITSATARTAASCSSPQPSISHVGERALYRARLPTMVLTFRDNHDFAVPIAAGEVFEVLGLAEDDRFVIVDVKGQEFLIFASDLKLRCKRVLQWQVQHA
ncbi:MAG TPA: hypothetical protein VH639_25960 [Bryobacteraceae bacterium]|jgi:hypothetical protein